jgi:transposase
MSIKIGEPEKIDEFLRKERDKSNDFKLLLLRLVNRIGNVKEVSDITGVPEATIYEWIREWNNEKEASLENHRGEGGGRKPKLNKAQIEKLREELKSREFWTTKEVKLLIKEKFGILYSEDQIVRILRKKLKMHFSKPFPIDYRRPEDAEVILENQLELLFSLLKEKGIKEEEIAIGFIDETRPQNTSNTARVWSFGKVRIIKNTTKFKTNTIGFYAIKGESLKEFLDNSEKESIASFLEKIKKENEKYKAIVAIIDNFASHKSNMVKEKAKELGIYLVYLPPYTPDLNPIEFIWKSIKRMLSLISVKSLDEMKMVISEGWNRFSKCLSYAEGWIKRFLKGEYYVKLCRGL